MTLCVCVRRCGCRRWGRRAGRITDLQNLHRLSPGRPQWVGATRPSRATRALYGDGDVASKPLKPLFSNTLLSVAATRPLTHAPACRFAATHWGMVLPLRGHSPLHQPHLHNMHISLSKQDILGSMHSSQLNTSVLQHCTQMLMCSAITWTLASVSCESGV